MAPLFSKVPEIGRIPALLANSMNIAKLNSLVCRFFFTAALVLFAVSVLDKVAALMGYSLLGNAYTPGRLFELATLLVVFVIALMLREIREELKKNK